MLQIYGQKTIFQNDLKKRALSRNVDIYRDGYGQKTIFKTDLKIT